MNIILLGAAGFIGKNLAIKLSQDNNNFITLVDKEEEYFNDIRFNSNVAIKKSELNDDTDFDSLLRNQDIVFHLVSSNIPTNSNKNIFMDIQNNLVFTSKLLESCIKNSIKKVVFISSGGTVYGKSVTCPLSEEMPTNPITSYGLQKLTIEKLLYLCNYVYGLDYSIIRLANPYGPYQRPNGQLGAVTTFVYKAINNEPIVVYGDGTIIRDFIYIDDAVNAILNIMNYNGINKLFNVGSGSGTSINEILENIKSALGCNINIIYKESRSVDVPVNYLDISRYIKEFGKLNSIDLKEGIVRTAEFLRKE